MTKEFEKLQKEIEILRELVKDIDTLDEKTRKGFQAVYKVIDRLEGILTHCVRQLATVDERQKEINKRLDKLEEERVHQTV